MKKTIILLAAVAALSLPASAQSKGYKLGKWVEIQNAILKELNRSYVDSLPLDRIEKAGINAMLEELDPYTIYVPEEETEDLSMMLNKAYGGIGAIIYKPELDGNVIINEPYAGSPAAKNGLQCGDEIEAIDGVTVHGLTSSQSSERMKGKPGTTVVFTVRKVRTGEVKDITITRERIKLPDVEFAGMLDDTTGYIYQTGFTEGVSSTVRDAVIKMKAQGMKKLVLDLRGNGGGLLDEAVNIVSCFVPKGSLVVYSKGKVEQMDRKYYTSHDPVDTELPLVVLVNSGSASASEIVSGALQDLDRATIMGTRTFGKGLVQSMRSMPYNGQMKITTAKYYTPSGRCVQAIDYSRRNEDGSVGHIPDSLTHEFKTAHGRTVRDGGGITPDIVIKAAPISRIAYATVAYGLTDYYSIEYCRKHESIADPEVFTLSDEDYAEFVEWAKDRELDYRSEAKTLFDEMKKELEEDGLASKMSEQLAAMEKALDLDKKTMLELGKKEIKPLLEEEIAVRYKYQEAGIRVRIRYDEQLREALTKPLISIE